MNKSQIEDISLIRFFSNNIMNLKHYPNKEISSHFSKYNKDMLIDTTVISNANLRSEYKDIIKCILVNKTPYSYKHSNFRYLISLPGYLRGSGLNTLYDLNMSQLEDLIKYYNSIGLKYEKSIISIINALPKALQEFQDERKGFERDVWRMEDLSINQERLDKSKSKYDIDFRKIVNLSNRELIKKWIKYLLGCTEYSYSTIVNHLSRVYQFSDFIRDTSLLDATHENVVEFMNLYSSMTDNYYNHNLLSIKSFYEYLAIKNYDVKELIIYESDFRNEKIEYKSAYVEDTIIFQLFNHLHFLPEHLRLIFLIDYCTGIRISDICQLKIDCLFKDDKGGFFLKHKVQKMQNFNGIPIPDNLYILIDERIKRLLKENSNQIYLFPAERNKNNPYLSISYSRKMKDYVREWGIKNNDGTDYNFKTHAFRHTIATDLFKNGMPVEMIQIGVLHHKSINMSMFYIERSEDYQSMIKDQYLDIKGNKLVISDINLTDAALPNGVCGLPISLGDCPNNVCLDCQFFRTSFKFLEIHRQELDYINKQIKYFETNNFKDNLKSALNQKEKLELIINKLEEIKEVTIDGN